MTEAGISHYPRRQYYWSDEQVTQLRHGISLGQTADEIALVLGRPAKSIREKCSNLGLVERPRPATHWSKELIAKAVRLYETGYSAAACAVELGCTRNAVIGKWYRHPDLFPPRAHIVNGKSTVKKMRARGLHRVRRMLYRPAAPVPRFVPKEIIELPADQSECAVTFAELAAHHCRWPLTTAGMSCGEQQREGYPYCSRHCRIAYVSPHSRGRRHFSLRERTA